MRYVRATALSGFAALHAFTPVPAAAGGAEVRDLANLTIEELAELEVQSASKQAEPISAASTAIFVITDEDVVRSGATSLPEALRLAPNLQVQRLDARNYAISARGFNGYETANKLLVLVDGRTVYTPLHSGVFWEQHAPLLEDVQQIEVISGPGGTLYGPNAVNGVVNVTSKDARETLGGLVRMTAGPEERTLGLRYGTTLGTGALRVYANGFDREGMGPGPRTAAEGDFRGWQAGFRADLGSPDSQVTVQGDLYDNDINLLPGDGGRGHNVLARWIRRIGGASSLRLHGYYDEAQRRYLRVREKVETFDAEAQLNSRLGAHELVVGGGVRTTRDTFVNNLNAFVLVPQTKRLWIGNVFLQDRFAAGPNLDIVAGVKLEHGSFTGIEILPNLRVGWRPTDKALLWAAVSRAVRTPSRIDRQLQNLPFLAPAPGFRSEKLIAFEAGYRGQPTSRTSASVSVFYNLYDDIRTTEFGPGGTRPVRLANSLKGETWGVEAWLVHQLLPWWRGSLGIATLHKNFELKNGAVDLANRAALGMDPDYQITARSSMDISDRLMLDLTMRAVDDLRESGRGDYVEADARLAWQASAQLELFVAGSNLLHDRHLESSDLGRAHPIERSVHAGTRVRF
jgi:iron complex outermembrane receptor protein